MAAGQRRGVTVAGVNPESAVDPKVYLNGRYLPLSEACVPVMDRGFLFGDGVYEVIPAYGGRLFRLHEHLERLEASLQAIGMAPPLAIDAWPARLTPLIEPFDGADCSVYLQITRGVAPYRDHLPSAGLTPTVFAMGSAIPTPNPTLFETGARAVTTEDLRWGRCDIKAITLLAAVMARLEANEKGGLEAILIRDGFATEGAASNLFVVRDGRLITPPKSRLLLPGITRDLVLELARLHDLPYAEEAIPLDYLRQADEVWLTSSTKEVLPVTRLDDQTIGNASPGPRFRQMRQHYATYKERIRRGEVV